MHASNGLQPVLVYAMVSLAMMSMAEVGAMDDVNFVDQEVLEEWGIPTHRIHDITLMDESSNVLSFIPDNFWYNAINEGDNVYFCMYYEVPNSDEYTITLDVVGGHISYIHFEPVAQEDRFLRSIMPED